MSRGGFIPPSHRETGRPPGIGATSVRKLGAVIGLFLLVITFVVAYNARATLRERDQTLVVNVAARQPALAERYIKDVVLEVNGRISDPADDAAILQHTADALLHGGMVRAVQGAEAEIEIPP